MEAGFRAIRAPESPLPEAPRLSYFVCCTPRSGSTLLCELLKSSGICGDADEYFSVPREPRFATVWGVTNFQDYLREALVRGTTANGVFGAKLIWSQFMYPLVERLRIVYGLDSVNEREVLEQVFPNLRYLFITRRDKARQAVSLFRARETFAWRSFEQPRTPVEEVRFDPAEIDRLMAIVAHDEGLWQQFFEAQGIELFHVAYEELIEDPEGKAMEILAYLGIEIPDNFVFGPGRLEKQGDAISEGWVETYCQWKRETGGSWTPRREIRDPSMEARFGASR
jgi:trehalose 2-sulfotransferase